MKVLIVDDEDLIREVTKLSLEAGGHDVLEAEDGPAGVLLAEAERPDVILLDRQMPGMDGLATLSALRGRPATAMIPVVFLSAGSGGDYAKELIALGAAGVLEKPFDPMGLSAALAAVLEGN